MTTGRTITAPCRGDLVQHLRAGRYQRKPPVLAEGEEHLLTLRRNRNGKPDDIEVVWSEQPGERPFLRLAFLRPCGSHIREVSCFASVAIGLDELPELARAIAEALTRAETHYQAREGHGG